MGTSRPIQKLVTSHRQTEGGGFIVRRPFPTQGLMLVDPFLLLDEMGPIDYAPGEAVGAPDHPHRGFETVSYILEGELEHEDSAGNKGRLSAGDVQWMTAGKGVVHSEMPSRRMQTEGGRVHGFQIWVNLPSKDKLMPPRYQDVAAASIPSAQSPDGKASVRVVAGEAFGVRAVIDTRIPIVYQHWTLQPGAQARQPLLPSQAALVYVFKGSVQVGPDRLSVNDGQMAILGAGDEVELGRDGGATGPAELLLLAGVPLNEPVARYGPFVMNTEAELEQAFDDYRAGRLAPAIVR